MTGQKFEMVMMALFAGFGIGYVIFHPPGPSVGERLAAIERDCGLQLSKGSKIKYSEDLYDALAKMTPGQLQQWEQSAKEAQRHWGLALEFDPEAAMVFTNVRTCFHVGSRSGIPDRYRCGALSCAQVNN
jgi:hypothetical protein